MTRDDTISKYDILKIEHDLIRESSMDVWECVNNRQRADLCLWIAGASAMAGNLIELIERYEVENDD